MNPLSAINAYVTPNGLIQMLPKSASARPITETELQGLNNVTAPEIAAPGSSTPASFENLLTNMVHEVSAKQSTANDAVTGLLNGQNVSLHQTMIAAEEASVSFQLMVEVRNRLLDSYQELMRMQI